MVMRRTWLRSSPAKVMPSLITPTRRPMLNPLLSTPPLPTTRRNTKNRTGNFHLHQKATRGKQRGQRALIHRTEKARNQGRKSECYTRSLLTSTLVSVALAWCPSSGMDYLLEGRFGYRVQLENLQYIWWKKIILWSAA